MDDEVKNKNIVDNIEAFLFGEVDHIECDGLKKETPLDIYKINVVKRLENAFVLFRSDVIYKEDFFISLRHFLITFQAAIKLPNSLVPDTAHQLISRRNDGKYYSTVFAPDYINDKFVRDVFLSIDNTDEKKRGTDYSLDTCNYISELTGYNKFRSESQKIVVNGALKVPDGHTALIALPTGGGKSLITQTIAYQDSGLTVVVVPTVSLAIDQRDAALRVIKRVAVREIFCYYSGCDNKEQLFTCIKEKDARLLFISPEALLENEGFKHIIENANKEKYLKNIIIDEAHIVLEWGAFFRTDYQALEPWRKSLIEDNPDLRTYLMSATFGRNSAGLLRSMFSDKTKWIEIRCDALRSEPRFTLIKTKGYREKRRKIEELVRLLPRPMIIYVKSPDDAEKWKEILRETGFNNIRTFTGETKNNDRETIIEEWRDNNFDLMIATSAFGLGVDKPDVRTVLHVFVPENPDIYYQELGRGGRDGLPCLSIMCISENDVEYAFSSSMGSKVLTSDKIVGRWESMYNSHLAKWEKETVWLDTTVKPSYNKKGINDRITEYDIKWNIYVILMFRRHDLIEIESVEYIKERDRFLFEIKVIDDSLKRGGEAARSIIEEAREKEQSEQRKEFNLLVDAIRNDNKFCWSEMFYQTYPLVDEYCAGCNNHEKVSKAGGTKKILKRAVSTPFLRVCEETRCLFGAANEILVLTNNPMQWVMNNINHEDSITVVGDNEVVHAIDRFSNNTTNVLMTVAEVVEYAERESWYMLGGLIVMTYIKDQEYAATQFCEIRSAIRGKIKVIHLMDEDYYISSLGKRVSAVVDIKM